MNQFTTEHIVNSVVETVGKETFRVTEAGKFVAVKMLTIPKENIKAIFKRANEEETAQKVKLTISQPGDTGKVYRMHVVLKSVDSNPSDFQNSLTRNNKEFNVEVKGDTAVNMAKKVSALLTKATIANPKFTVYNDPLGSAIINLTAIDGFTRFECVELQELVPNFLGKEEVIVLDTMKEVTPGKSGFGTAHWIMRNLRLPTAAATNWTATHLDERPDPTKKYNQYTIRVVADRGELTGMGAVGQSLTSITTHVFYVADGTASAQIESAFKALETGVNMTEVTDKVVAAAAASTASVKKTSKPETKTEEKPLP